MTTNETGAESESRIVAALVSKGYQVSLPFNDCRYDLVVDTGDGLYRVECKTGRLKNGVVESKLYGVWSGEDHVYTEKDIDFFAIYCKDNETVYTIRVEEAPNWNLRLRIDPPENGQEKGIRWAEDYEL